MLSARSKIGRRCRPMLECLEDRLVPATGLSNVQFTPGNVNRDAPAVLRGAFSDAAPDDAFTLVVNWGDGSATETFNYAAGTLSFSERHAYAAPGSYAVSLALRDSDHTGALLYGSNVGRQLFTIDVATGSGTLVGSLPGTTQNVTEIVHDNFRQRSWLQYGGNVFQGQEFNSATGSAVGGVIANVPAENFTGMAFNGGTLYASGTTNTGGTSPSDLRILDPLTGQSTLIGLTGLNGPLAGLAYDEESGVLYGIRGGTTTTNNLVRLDLSTGAATPLFSTGFAGGSLAFGPDGELYAGSNSGQLYRIDVTNQSAALVGATGFSGAVSGLTLVDAAPPATASLTIKVKGDTKAQRDAYTVSEDAALTVSAAEGVLANDPSATATSQALLVRSARHGQLTLAADGSFSYTPDPDFSGRDHFTYRLVNGLKRSQTVRVNLGVTPVADPTLTQTDSYQVRENRRLEVSARRGVLANDADADTNALRAVLVTGPQHGTLRLRANGSFVYRPDANYSGPDSFTYSVVDGTDSSAPVTVSLQIASDDDPGLSTLDALFAALASNPFWRR